MKTEEKERVVEFFYTGSNKLFAQFRFFNKDGKRWRENKYHSKEGSLILHTILDENDHVISLTDFEK